MRIITGTAKGTKLLAPNGLDVRPTGDRVKESLFNILGTLVIKADVLDLFAGTGNLGLEALSRGANSSVFVDSSSASLAIIRQNAERTHLSTKADIVRAEVLKAVDRFDQEKRSFDLVFCDPPYNKGYVQSVLSKIDNSKILRSGGVVIFEHSRHEEMNVKYHNMEVVRSEKYGETIVTFIKTLS